MLLLLKYYHDYCYDYYYDYYYDDYYDDNYNDNYYDDDDNDDDDDDDYYEGHSLFCNLVFNNTLFTPVFQRDPPQPVHI